MLMQVTHVVIECRDEIPADNIRDFVLVIGRETAEKVVPPLLQLFSAGALKPPLRYGDLRHPQTWRFPRYSARR
jgi:hypothetical protein